jgi:hypothetical protein
MLETKLNRKREKKALKGKLKSRTQRKKKI